MDAAQYDTPHLSPPLDAPHLDENDATSRMPSISLVLPAYNEQEVIAQAICEADEALAGITSDYEVLVVDDGSSDNTKIVAQQEASKRSAVRVLAHDQNRGYGAALSTGFRAAKKDVIGFTDADCQFDLRQLNRLVMLLSSCDIACGYRIDRQDSPIRILYSKVYNFGVRLLLGTRVRDCDCAMKLFRRDALETISFHSNGFLINAEILAIANMQGKRVVEVGVNHRPRPRGTSTVSFWHVFPVLLALLRFWWSHIQFPARSECQARPFEPVQAAQTSLVTLALGLLCALVFFMNLSYPLIEPDENRYAQIALEMVQSGNYLVPRLQGKPYLDKPPLLYWTTAASFNAFGINEFSARLVSALAATWTVLFTFVLGQRFLGRRTALIGAVMLLLSMGFVLAGRYVILDGLLTSFTTTSLLAGYLAIRGVRLRWSWWILAAVACGLGILAKGPIALVLIAPPLLGLQLLGRRAAPVRLHQWLAWGTVAVGVALPWFVAVALTQPDFVSYFLWKHHIVRFLSAFDHQAPIWYYIPVLLIGMFPCSLLTAPVVAFLVGRSAKLRRARTEELGFVVLAATWVFVFFSASSCKLPTYVLPAAPLLCLIAAVPLNLLLTGVRPRLPLETLTLQLPKWATAAALLVGAGLAITDLLLQPNQGIEQSINWFVLASTGIYLAYLPAARHLRTRKMSPWLVATATSIFIMMFAFQKFVPQFAAYRSVHANAARIQVAPDGHVLPVVYLDWQIDGESLYFQRRGIDFFSEGNMNELAEYARAHGEMVLVANSGGAEHLRERLGESATFTKLPGARGRLYVVSTSTNSPTLVGARKSAPTRR